MCKWVRSGANRIDPCMREVVSELNRQGFETVASCCGHGIYPKTVVVKIVDGMYFEFFSSKVLPRRRRFYRRDKQGVFYIAEVC